MNARAGELRVVEDDAVEQAGQRILGLIQQTAAIADQNIRNARNAADELAFQLRAAEERIRDLEGALRFQYARADRAEEWLKRISNEIAQSLPSNRPAAAPGSSGNPASQAQPVAPPATGTPAEIEVYVKGRRKVG